MAAKTNLESEEFDVLQAVHARSSDARQREAELQKLEQYEQDNQRVQQAAAAAEQEKAHQQARTARQADSTSSRVQNGKSRSTTKNSSTSTGTGHTSEEFLNIDEIAKLAEARQSLQPPASAGPNCISKHPGSSTTTATSVPFNIENNGKQQIPLPGGAQPGAYSGAPGMDPQRTTRPRFSLLGVASATVEPMADLSDRDGSLASEDREEPETSESARAHSENRSFNEGQVAHLSSRTNSQTVEHANHGDNFDVPVVNNAANSDSTGLAVAALVEEDEMSQDLPQAAEFDVDELRRRKEESMKIFKTKMLLAVILCTAAVLVLIAVLINRERPKDSESEPSLETATNISAPPSSDIMEKMQDDLLALFEDKTALAIRDDPESPQSRAFQWLLDDIDGRQAEPSNDRLRQRFALATLYFATSGDSWANNQHWLNHSIHECDWFTKPDFALKEKLSQILPGYITEMFPPTDPPPSNCHDNGLYRNLWLDQNNLQGTLAEELFLISSLETLSIGVDSLHGSISTQVGRLSLLQGISISFVRDAGPIPSEIGMLTNLRTVLVSDNEHSGSVPTELWQLTNLVSLSLGNNGDLKSAISTEVGNIPKLRWLVMDFGGVSGTIPTEMGRLKHLEWLALQGNSLTGTVPCELGLLQNILSISLQNNSLLGTLPSELGLLTSLTMLTAGQNTFSGSIPSEYGRLSSLNLALKLEESRLSGTIPVQLADLVSLETLYLQDNHFTGHIPSEFGKMSSLGLLNLSNNSLSGVVPQELGELKQSLFTLNLEENPLLSGVFPESLCGLDGECAGTALVPCEGNYGIYFDCNSLMCGCGCTCDDN
ncbi:LRR receptor-like serine threonine-protein kinase [Seminavis robusta]|uniref:LRR receptor-like serine threonine-protein kinase n=1 Tax=Seminavis robusta TaxID=568900 RepID=A0A9N8HXD8_9STRA|nr:LRR receptor-like serine threonine-protein kinase [Seminavis robusta]|eukprot:Sro1792_g297900.1 LRR receptor-like serine threonine-protein kinase (830) ;mRNA; f:18044-20607